MSQTQSFELTGFQRDLLYVVAGSDQPSGQTVRREMEQYVDNVNHGRLYPNLDVLVEHSLVEKGSQDQRTNYYEVTESGEQLLTDRLKWENQYVSGISMCPIYWRLIRLLSPVHRQTDQGSGSFRGPTQNTRYCCLGRYNGYSSHLMVYPDSGAVY